MAKHPRFVDVTAEGRLICTVCPRNCKLQEGQRGFCFVRQRQGDDIALVTYGRSSGFCMDPVEKKPLYHFLPGSAVLSFGTAGCNLGCKFCQNWSISTSRYMDTVQQPAPPQSIATAAREFGAGSVAYTYNDPVIFLEYAVDTAMLCHEQGVKNIAVTAGYINAGARESFFRHMDAANVDLKAFSESFYRRMCAASLAPVLETLEYLHSETNVWVEITTLVIPGENDSEAELHQLTEWIADRLDPETPLHFTAFHPDYHLQRHLPTGLTSLKRAAQIATDNGLKHVYLGNTGTSVRSTTHCANCNAHLIKRRVYEVTEWNLNATACCSACGAELKGRFNAGAGNWGNRTQPVGLGTN